MRVKLTENQFYKVLVENSFDEEGRKLPAKAQKTIYDAGQDLAKDVYGDEFGKDDTDTAERYRIDNYKKDADIKGGLFSVGNQKLSPDTLIINFTSAFGCPSAVQCPISQAACYAVAGENRLTGTRNKNVKVHKLLAKCNSQDKLGRFFQIAELYITLLQNSKTPIKWIRFNEAGDFPNQKVLNMATKFAEKVEQQYGVKSMAYTARGDLNFSEASKVIAINASTNKVLSTIDDNSPKRNFFGVNGNTFDYNYVADAEENKVKKNLENNPNAEEVSNNTLEKLTINGTIDGDITTPILQYGKWGNGNEEQGYYYVCPCSFWKDRKDQIEIPYCKNYLNEPPYDMRHLTKQYGKDSDVVKKLKSQLNKVKSPCGVVCAVCHDRKGGIDKESGQRIKDYAVLTGIHGSTGSKYNPLYARLKRMGDNNAQWSNTNKNGRWNNPGGKGEFGTIPTPNK